MGEGDLRYPVGAGGGKGLGEVGGPGRLLLPSSSADLSSASSMPRAMGTLAHERGSPDPAQSILTAPPPSYTLMLGETSPAHGGGCVGLTHHGLCAPSCPLGPDQAPPQRCQFSPL